MRFIDLTGQRFGRLVVLERAKNDNSNRVRWLCRCDCGKTAIVKSGNLRNGMIKSCGCLRQELSRENSTTHGQSRTRLYRIWCGMKRRCYNTSDKSYPDYGGRGITVCPEWLHDFAAFRDWALSHGYTDDLSIDRIDNDKGYSLDNCRWVGGKQQSRNRRSNRMITYKGETKSLSQWAEQFHISQKTLRDRLVEQGWSIEKALETPVK